MDKINNADLVAFALFTGLFPIECDPVYGQPSHAENLFGPIYHADAQIWGHRDLVKITLLAAKRMHTLRGWVTVIKDCLRTVEAQERIGAAPISQANPQWFVEPRMMSPPGMGAHPRGMAIDLAPKGIDMGTVFDSMTPQAARNWTEFSPDILDNRKFLEDTMMIAAQDLNLPLHPLSNEWWDFRFPGTLYNQYAPLREVDLTACQRMTERPAKYTGGADVQVLQDLSGFI